VPFPAVVNFLQAVLFPSKSYVRQNTRPILRMERGQDIAALAPIRYGRLRESPPSARLNHSVPMTRLRRPAIAARPPIAAPNTAS
jgi:hypothetical protein